MEIWLRTLSKPLRLARLTMKKIPAEETAATPTRPDAILAGSIVFPAFELSSRAAIGVSFGISFSFSLASFSSWAAIGAASPDAPENIGSSNGISFCKIPPLGPAKGFSAGVDSVLTFVELGEVSSGVVGVVGVVTSGTVTFGVVSGVLTWGTSGVNGVADPEFAKLATSASLSEFSLLASNALIPASSP